MNEEQLLSVVRIAHMEDESMLGLPRRYDSSHDRIFLLT